MLKKVACNICNSNYYSLLFKPSRAADLKSYCGTSEIKEASLEDRVVRCLQCGLIYLNPRPDISQLYDFYSNLDVQDICAEEEAQRKTVRIILERLNKLKPERGKLLCVGCAAGFFLDEARKSGWQVSGVDLSFASAGYIKDKFSLEIFRGSLKKANFAPSSFEVIVIYDTLEHFTQPKQTLIEARKILKKDGLLCLNVINTASFWSAILKSKWWGIQEQHLFYFTRDTLLGLLEAAGFKALYCRAHRRVRSFRYLYSRFKKANQLAYKLFEFISRKVRLEDKLFTIITNDQLIVFARKARKLAYLDELEESPLSDRKAKRRLKTIVVLPAYNAAQTLTRTVEDIPREYVDEIILVDDASSDNTTEVAKQLGLVTFTHKKNMGYGGNQKTCYQEALKVGADIVVMVHPDYQYDPKAIPELIEPIKKGRADAVFGSRMMKGGALEGGMPAWKHNANILLTALENVVLGTYLTEYHSGFRAYSRKYLQSINFLANSNGFVFDTQIIVQGLISHMRIEEVPIKTRYFDEASTIKLIPSIIYGLSILRTLLRYILHRKGILRFN